MRFGLSHQYQSETVNCSKGKEQCLRLFQPSSEAGHQSSALADLGGWN